MFHWVLNTPLKNEKKAAATIGICHCVKTVHIWSFSGLHFPEFGLNTEVYFVNLRIQSECGKIRTIKTLNMDTFHAVCVTYKSMQSHQFTDFL